MSFESLNIFANKRRGVSTVLYLFDYAQSPPFTHCLSIFHFDDEMMSKNEIIIIDIECTQLNSDTSAFIFIRSSFLQPSLSLDNTVEVFLLKNEGDFVSVEQGQKLGGEKKLKKREDNIRQLLDVTNTITSEEMRDFEMRSVRIFHRIS